eukprot:6173618-Pleurochrysis_carterae.AAC.3
MASILRWTGSLTRKCIQLRGRVRVFVLACKCFIDKSSSRLNGFCHQQQLLRTQLDHGGKIIQLTLYIAWSRMSLPHTSRVLYISAR